MSRPLTAVTSSDARQVLESDVALPPPLDAGEARRVVQTVAGWLASPAAELIARDSAIWSQQTWRTAQRVISIHGLAPHLASSGLISEGANIPPAELATWLVEQESLNRARIDRIHQDLVALLKAATRDGIEVMPLKGSLVTTLPLLGGYVRPMSDIDVLVRPAQREAATRLLAGLGYDRIDQGNPRPTHDVFLRPGSRVVSVDEHPDNPRRVELHTEVVRHLWGWFDSDELTDALWARAQSRSLLGETAVVPHFDDLFAHLAVHASSDLLAGRGRLVQWLDIARLAAAGARLSRPVHERVAFIAVRLAERAFPGSVDPGDLEELERRVPRGLAASVATAPLDDRSGLFLDYPRQSPSSMAERWRRWRPTRRRLWAAYGDVPLPMALARYGRHLVGLAASRGR
jgi:hypothetical protein